jgi:hypothetical protein
MRRRDTLGDAVAGDINRVTRRAETEGRAAFAADQGHRHDARRGRRERVFVERHIRECLGAAIAGDRADVEALARLEEIAEIRRDPGRDRLELAGCREAAETRHDRNARSRPASALAGGRPPGRPASPRAMRPTRASVRRRARRRSYGRDPCGRAAPRTARGGARPKASAAAR